LFIVESVESTWLGFVVFDWSENLTRTTIVFWGPFTAASGKLTGSFSETTEFSEVEETMVTHTTIIVTRETLDTLENTVYRPSSRTGRKV